MLMINEQNFIPVDLNLLVVFMVLYYEQNLSRTAERLGVGQPAISGSLVRLRRCFGDPLFTRCRRGVIPTPKAHKLIATLQPAMIAIEDVLCEGSYSLSESPPDWLGE